MQNLYFAGTNFTRLDVDITAYYGNNCVLASSNLVTSTETKPHNMIGHLLTNVKAYMSLNCKTEH